MLDDYTDRYADYFPDAYVKFKQLDYQNVSSPLEIRFMGDDIARLKQAGDSLMAVLREMDGLVWVHTNYEEGLTRRTGSIGPSGSLPPRDHEGDGLGRSGDPLRRPLGWLPLGRRLRFADPAEIR